MIICSVSDIGTDFFLLSEYLWSREQHFIFSALTLTYIYLPALNTIAALIGPRRTAFLSIVGGFFTGILGSTGGFFYTWYFDLDTHNVYDENPVLILSLLSLFLLGLGYFFLGWVLWASSKRRIFSWSHDKCFTERFFTTIFVVILLPISPLIYIIIKLLAVFKSENKFIQAQSRLTSQGEAVLEATPQFVLLLYVVMTTLSPTNAQIFSLVTSSLTLSLPNIERYVIARDEEYGFKSILKNISVFLTFSMFKVLSIAVMFRFFGILSFGLLFIEIVLVAITMGILNCCFKLESKGFTLGLESIFLGWLTMTNLQHCKGAAFARLVSSIVTLIYKSLIVEAIILIKNYDPSIPGKFIPFLDWNDLKMVNDINTMDLTFGIASTGYYTLPAMDLFLHGTVCLGVLSLVLDILTGCCKDETFLESSIILEGLKGCRCCDEEK